ncbi:SDR family oxidoreductase [Chachezhania antarctica]|uniref:SDR family oxidoreductase n=1 Tax=Chachezhania antarctica TaxID=2340860 RepID=UPI000EB29A7A|nr:SDR family oxidoreductase [Chachezhania antarctica]|tara:strand:+ start:5364 stop:6164 length:801 start_codon:yes stop_codon:yes gene_type:complete
MSPPDPLHPRALVTGAGLRLGREMALYLASRGFDVAVHYRSSADAAEEVAAEIRAMGRQAVTLQADLMVEDEAQALLPAAARALGGPVTCLVNNASTFEHDDFDTATRESWDRHLESNLRAPFVLMQAMASQDLSPDRDANGEARATGLVVNMIDQRVLKPTPHFMSYTVSKMALWALTRTAAQALAPRIRVNAIGPGPTLQGAHQDGDIFARQRKATILERGADGADITAALGYFLEAPAVTGQLICPDGGQHLAWETPDIFGTE